MLERRVPATLRGTRVLLRAWRDGDLPAFAALNADPVVMRHFVSVLARAESDAFAGRIRDAFATRGYSHWALEVPGLAFAGFVGLAPVPFALPDMPSPQVEIGWRLARAAWGRGYATEAALLVLAHAFSDLRLMQIVSFTALGNEPSQAVMRRIGMRRVCEFDHPRIPSDRALSRHVLYAIGPHSK